LWLLCADSTGPPGKQIAEIERKIRPITSLVQGCPKNSSADRTEMVFMTLTTKSSFRTEFKSGDGGTNLGGAVCMTRWVNTQGEMGQWSKFDTAIVAALGLTVTA